ncbi:MAG: glycosyltransferase family 2 protein [Acidimicrobiales bacterium]
MSAAPEVAVVIPTHDRIAMLGEAVASVLAERTVALQVVVVDDASSDGTAAWLAALSDPRVEHESLDPGRGGSGARNVGLERCRAPHVLFLDDDDVVEPGAIPALLGALSRHPRAVRAVGAHRVFGTAVRSRRATHPRVPMTLRTWRAELVAWNMPPGAVLWRTAVVRQLGGWDETLRRAEDAELCLRAWEHPATLIPDTVLRYRYHASQVPTPQAWPLDWAARRGFVESLPAGPRAEGERLMHCRELYQQALEHHLEGRFGAAASGFAAVVRADPRLALSPLTGPYLDGLLVRAALGAALPHSMAAPISGWRRRRRGRVPDTRRAPSADDQG